MPRGPMCSCGRRRDETTGRCTAIPSCDDFPRQRPKRRPAPPEWQRGNMTSLLAVAERSLSPVLAAQTEANRERARRGWKSRRASR